MPRVIKLHVTFYVQYVAWGAVRVADSALNVHSLSLSLSYELY